METQELLDAYNTGIDIDMLHTALSAEDTEHLIRMIERYVGEEECEEGEECERKNDDEFEEEFEEGMNEFERDFEEGMDDFEDDFEDAAHDFADGFNDEQNSEEPENQEMRAAFQNASAWGNRRGRRNR